MKNNKKKNAKSNYPLGSSLTIKRRRKIGKILLITLICVAIYFASLAFNYYCVKVRFSAGGKDEYTEPNKYTLVATYTPAINTAISIFFIMDWPPHKNNPKPYENHFGIVKADTLKVN